MKIVVVGLGKMGAQIAQMFIAGGHEVVGVDPNPETVAAARDYGAIGSSSRADALTNFGDGPAIVWLMIPAQFVGEEVSAWAEILPAGSIVIDGGNTDFRQSPQHAEMLAARGSHLVDVGVSGGILGLTQGFSMMAGGDEAVYRQITPLLDSLVGTRGGYDYFGPVGAGHYVKMVHNAVEYGMMESLAEGYRMLREGPYQSLDLARVGDVWQHASVIESTLNSLAAEVMHHDASLGQATGYVAESGEGHWTLEVAQERGIDLPAIQVAFDVRKASESGQTSYATKLLAELRNKFGGHPLNTNG